jgi:hypothetical protein
MQSECFRLEDDNKNQATTQTPEAECTIWNPSPKQNYLVMDRENNGHFPISTLPERDGPLQLR